MRKRVFLAVLAFLVLVAGAGAGVWLWDKSRTRDVRGSATQEFVSTQGPAVPRPAPEVLTEPWPLYGYDSARTRFAAGFDLRPPYRKLWTVNAGSLVEFPPVIAYGRLYVATYAGKFLAIDAATGEIVWTRKFGRFTAASPAVADGVVYQPLMNSRKEDRATAPGYMVALDAETGEELWRFRARVIESSPLVFDDLIVFGSFDKKVYAVDVNTHKVRWSFTTGDAVKGGPALRGGRIYTGSYDGKVYALNARTGKRRWSTSGQSGLAGGGNFYATPAVAYGRVFIGSTDGKMYAFGARSGDLLWSQTTGGYVYSSAAIWRKRVYVGSYDRHLYALEAATGDVAWSFRVRGAISGSPTVLGGLVYFSTLRGKTYALDASSGKVVWRFPDGRYTPAVSDGDRLFITGRSRIHALTPTSN